MNSEKIESMIDAIVETTGDRENASSYNESGILAIVIDSRERKKKRILRKLAALRAAGKPDAEKRKHLKQLEKCIEYCERKMTSGVYTPEGNNKRYFVARSLLDEEYKIISGNYYDKDHKA